MKQTAVEFLETQIIKFHKWKLNSIYDENCFDEIELHKAINQAKKIENKQKGYSKEEAKKFMIDSFIAGNKHKQERSYSEQDMKIAFDANIKDWISFKEFIEQLKNK